MLGSPHARAARPARFGCGCDLAKPYLFGERCLLAVYISLKFLDLKHCRFATSICYHWESKRCRFGSVV